MWWQQERVGRGTLRHYKAALKGKGIIRFIASNKSSKSQKILIQLINPAPGRGGGRGGGQKVNREQICEAATHLEIARLIRSECRCGG